MKKEREEGRSGGAAREGRSPRAKSLREGRDAERRE
jgi:hypothetical protein